MPAVIGRQNGGSKVSEEGTSLL